MYTIYTMREWISTEICRVAHRQCSRLRNVSHEIGAKFDWGDDRRSISLSTDVVDGTKKSSFALEPESLVSSGCELQCLVVILVVHLAAQSGGENRVVKVFSFTEFQVRRPSVSHGLLGSTEQTCVRNI